MIITAVTICVATGKSDIQNRNGNNIHKRFVKQTYHGLHLANGQLLELVGTPSTLAPVLSFPALAGLIRTLLRTAIMPQLNAPTPRSWVPHESSTKQGALSIWHRSGWGSTQGRVKMHAKTHGFRRS
jgi:hypothetical protein